MYSKSWCPYCRMAKRLLARRAELDRDRHRGAARAARARWSSAAGARTVPQIWIGDRHVGGFDDLAALDASGELDALLGRS